MLWLCGTRGGNEVDNDGGEEPWDIELRRWRNERGSVWGTVGVDGDEASIADTQAPAGAGTEDRRLADKLHDVSARTTTTSDAG